MRILVKVGGAQLEEPAARAELVHSVALARAAGIEVVLVHGGGNQIRALVRKLGLPERYHEGLRVTDAETADVVLMVLGGLVGKTLAKAFEEQGVRAVSLCGADGSTFGCVPERREDVDLGFVGSVGRVDPRLVETLLAEDYLPLVATVGPGKRELVLQRERRHGRGPLASALGAQALLFLTDVPGCWMRTGTSSRADSDRCAELRAEGVVSGGMIPKVEAALAALETNPGGLVKIAPSAGPNAVLAALDPGVGTQFIAMEEAWTSTSC